MKWNRRNFIKDVSMASAGFGICYGLSCRHTKPNAMKKLFFDISLAEWSLHRTLQRGEITNMDFPAKAKNDFGISAVEYVDQFFHDKARDKEYLNELKMRTSDLNVRNLLIMVDTAGALAEPDDATRIKAVENHYQWIDAAKFLGCHSIRVNLRGTGSEDDLKVASIDALGRLSEYGAENEIGVIVENHGGVSSDAKWLINVIKQVNNPFCGTLPDFDNWCITYENTDDGRHCINEYDRYEGTREMMPYAKAVSAKSRSFNENGNEINLDFLKFIRIVNEEKTEAFKGFIGIEYAGNILSEDEGIMATRNLLERVGQMVE